MHPSRLWLVASLLIVLPLAGCVEDIGPPVSARSVPTDAPSSGGSGSYDLTVRIVDEPGGPAIPNAAIVAYWGDFSGSGGTFDAEGSAEGGGASGSVSGVVRLSSNPNTPEPDSTVPLRTGADGTATVHAPANRVIGIVAWSQGYTEEWVPAHATGDKGTSGNVTFPVYRSRITYEDEAAWGPAGASPGRVSGSNYMWRPEEVPWGDTAAARAGYVSRLASMRVHLNWTNGPTGGGDLSIGAGTTTGDPDHVQDSDNPQAGPGAQSEEAFLDTATIEELGWPSSDTLYVGPATSTAFAAPFGLDYDVQVEATFDPFVNPARFEGNADTPGPGAALVALVVGLVAVAGRHVGRWP